MPDKQKNAKATRSHKESKGTGVGARKTRLTDLQKVLLTGRPSRKINRAGLSKAKETDSNYRPAAGRR